jgi:hypothetical protein
MIVFELICPDQHRFEGWFASAGDFDGQKSRGLLSCPSCGKGSVEKLLTAKIGRGEGTTADLPVPAVGGTPNQGQVSLHEMIEHVLRNTENVGERFADEARAIHKEEAPSRAIRGTATRKETEKLLDEGVPIMPLPIPPKSDWH